MTIANPICDMYDKLVEDEYFSLIEKNETENMLLKRINKEKDAQIHKAVQALLQTGMSPEDVAETTGVNIETVNIIRSANNDK